MTSNPVEVAVVGVGYWGPNLVRVLMEDPTCHLAICCDADHAKLEKIRHRYPSIAVTGSAEDVWKSKVHAVVIATPVRTHATLTRQALAAGKHVLVEKPLASSIQEAEDVIDEVRRSGRILMVGHTFLFSPAVLKVKSLIECGDLGEIYYISSSRVNLGLYQKDINVLWDLGSHDLSILFYWLGETPTRIAAQGRACVHDRLEDVVFLSMEFQSKVIAQVEMSWLAPNKLRRTVVVGSRKMVLYDDTESNEKVRIYDKGVLFKQPDTYGEHQLAYRTGNVISPALENYEPLASEVRHFLECVQTGQRPRSGYDLGIQIVKALDAATRSLANNGALQALESVRLECSATKST